MLDSLLSEYHPQVNIKSIDIFENLLKEIQKLNEQDLKYDFNTTDSILVRIKQKIGDANSKIRKRAVGLYTYMLSQKFCDYNNLINELLEDETKEEFSIIKAKKSSYLILSKLDIITSVLNDYKKAINDKRTSIESFPYANISKYITRYITHKKRDVRLFARKVCILASQIIGFMKMRPFLKTVDMHELQKLEDKIPEIKEVIEEKHIDNSNQSLSNERGRSNGKRINNSSFLNRSMSKSNERGKCKYCGKLGKEYYNGSKDLENHYKNECLLHTICSKCGENLLVKNLNSHLLNKCQYKSNFKMCKRCREAVDIQDYETHSKELACFQSKSKNQFNRCPLCHRDIPPGDKGWAQHLVKEGCVHQVKK